MLVSCSWLLPALLGSLLPGCCAHFLIFFSPNGHVEISAYTDTMNFTSLPAWLLSPGGRDLRSCGASIIVAYLKPAACEGPLLIVSRSCHSARTMPKYRAAAPLGRVKTAVVVLSPYLGSSWHVTAYISPSPNISSTPAIPTPSPHYPTPHSIYCPPPPSTPPRPPQPVCH